MLITPITTNPIPVTRLLWREGTPWREDYNPNQPRDSRGRWIKGGGGGSGGSSGGKKSGGGGGLASKKVSELQKIAKEEGIDPNTLSHKRRKSVLAAAIEAKRKGKDLREAGLLKPTKTKGGLKAKTKDKTEKAKTSAKPKKATKDFDPSKDGELEPAIRKERNRLMMTDPNPPKPSAPLSSVERARLTAMDTRLSKIAESGTLTASDREYMKKIGVPTGQESVWARSEALRSADSPQKIKAALDLNYAQSTTGDYGQLYNRITADKLTKLGNKDLAEVASKHYMGGIKAGQPLKVSALENAPSVLTSELKRRGMLDADNPGKFKGKQVTDWKSLKDSDFTFKAKPAAVAKTTTKPKTSAKPKKAKPEPTGTHEDFSQTSSIKREEQLMERLGVDESEALAISNSIRSWTGTGYQNVKKYQRGKKNEVGEKISKNLDKFLYSDNISAFKGAVYRGITFRSEADRTSFVEKAKTEGIELRNHSSFSSNGKVAVSFANNYENAPAAIIRVTSNKSGKSIKNFSALREEDEVVVPIGTKYKFNGNYQRKTMSNGKIMDIIDVEEID